MAEAGASAPNDPANDPANDRDPVLDTELDRIQAAVEAGDTDLRALGFWRLVARVKTDRILIDRYADRIGRIDADAFRRRVRFRVPVWLGNGVLVTAAVVGGVLIGIAGTVDSETWKGLLVIAAGLDWAVAVHSPTHWLVGLFIGVRFTDYFLGGPPPPRPGLKSDYATYLGADPASRAWMHASGAIATKLAPFVASIFVPVVGAPWWSAAVLILVGLGQIVTDVRFSTKSGDWKKFLRERRVAKARIAS